MSYLDMISTITDLTYFPQNVLSLEEINFIASIMKDLNSYSIVLPQGILQLIARPVLTQAKDVINMQKQDNIA